MPIQQSRMLDLLSAAELLEKKLREVSLRAAQTLDSGVISDPNRMRGILTFILDAAHIDESTVALILRERIHFDLRARGNDAARIRKRRARRARES